MYQYQATTVDVDDKQGINSQAFAGCVNASERFLAFNNIDLKESRDLQFVASHITNSQFGLKNVIERGQTEKDDASFKLRPALETLLIPSISNDVLWTIASIYHI